ncbi:PREDICTED: zinc finger CCHC domain-containing protein 14 [Corvus brachyrhynchos]|uniref:zinc finger CCHC domain-containing protein 14 n=1 Tax=Corvus brachyrhynchos TaxID=85066 RepID=UPI000816443B|nr:PREDICTED: zinc finger CCHC domain-containing protein 14 [Corvus brachyrhynchos]
MASNHPAFSFHQKQVLRQELTQIQSLMASTSKNPSTSTLNTMATYPGCHKVSPRSETPINSVSNSLENVLHTSTHSMEESLPKRPSGKHSKVSVEKVELKGLAHKKNERNVEYSFEVLWSDSSVTLVTKSSAEVTEFISKLSQLYPEENLEKFIPCLAGPDSFYLERNHMDLESDLRYLAPFPSHVVKNDHVRKFFSTSSPSQQLQSSNPGNPSLYKVGTTLGTSGRPICGVAGIQSSQNHVQHSAAAPVALPHCSHSGGAGSSLGYRSQMDTSSPSMLMSSSPQTPQTQEQNGILDWLRKLRLHKYYPVFKQLTMEKFLSLTEEDLNKFESLTMGAKKKLKTQLELEKEKSEKRCLNPSTPSSVTSSGVARVPPTSHVGPIQSIRGNHAAELRVDVDQPAHPLPREGSSSEYSSSSSSPMGIQTREERSDSAEENERRKQSHTAAQCLPVRNAAGSGPGGHHALPMQMLSPTPSHITPIRMLSSVHKPERGSADMKLLSSSVHSLLTLEERNKVSPSSRGSIKMEKGFGNAVVDVMSASSPHQPLQVLSGAAESSSPTSTMNFGPRAKVVHASTLDRVIKPAQQPGLIVETSTAATVTSSTVFHVARPPIKLLVSSSLPTDSAMAGQTSCSSNMQITVSPAIINPRTALYTANTKVAFSAMSSMPVAPMQGSFCTNSNAASSSSHPSPSFTTMANLPSCPAPSSSPTLSSGADNNFYSRPGACSGNCGSSGMTVSYANYFQHPFSGPSMFTFPFLPFNPLCSNGYINTQQYNSSTTFPVVHTAYNSGLAPDSVMAGQSTFAVPPMQNFMAGTAGVYQAQGMMGNGNGSSHKKNGNLSCYNCGASGHRAQDCKQPPMDFNRQGTFRLKYAPPSESLDSTD